MYLECRRLCGAVGSVRRATKSDVPPQLSGLGATSRWNARRLFCAAPAASGQARLPPTPGFEPRSAVTAIKPPCVDRGDTKPAASPRDDVRPLRSFDLRPDRARPSLPPKRRSRRYRPGDLRELDVRVPLWPIADGREDIPDDLCRSGDFYLSFEPNWGLAIDLHEFATMTALPMAIRLCGTLSLFESPPSSMSPEATGRVFAWTAGGDTVASGCGDPR